MLKDLEVKGKHFGLKNIDLHWWWYTFNMIGRNTRHNDLKTWQRLDPGMDYSCHMSPA